MFRDSPKSTLTIVSFSSIGLFLFVFTRFNEFCDFRGHKGIRDNKKEKIKILKKLSFLKNTMSKKKHNIFHIIIRPKNDLYREIKYEELVIWIEESGASYCIAEEKGNHLHIALKFDDCLRQDDIRKRVKKFMRLDEESNDKIALKVKFHGDWEYLLGYIHKDGKIKEISYDIQKEEIERGLKRYTNGDKADYISSKKEEHIKKYWTCDEIVENFIKFCLEIKVDTYYEWAWFDFLSRNFDKFKYTTFARIRKDPLVEHVSAGLKYFKYYSVKKSGCSEMGITKKLPISLENKNDTAYIDDMFNDLT